MLLTLCYTSVSLHPYYTALVHSWWDASVSRSGGWEFVRSMEVVSGIRIHLTAVSR